MPPIARLESVSKLYGAFAALNKVTATFERGHCYVLLGENGAGKSTLLRVLAGLLTPTFGHASLYTDDSGQTATAPADERHRIGYVSHAAMMYDELSGLENLQYFARLYRGQPCLDPARALNQVGLDPKLHRPLGQYSRGMQQRASLARALLPQPDLLLLDEPFSNMDATGAGQMLSLLSGLRAQGRSILLSTHQRELAAPIADYFLTLQAGRLFSVEPAKGPPFAENER